MILTPDAAAWILDRLGPPRHLEAVKELSTAQIRRMFNPQARYRIRLVAKVTGLSERTVRRVVRHLMAERPSEP